MPTPDEMMQSGGMPAGVSPQAIQQIMQQSGGMNGGDITSILAQLAQMSPDEVSSALESLGVQVDPDTLQKAAENWVEGAADKASGVSGDGGPTDDAAEGEGGPAPPAQPTGSAPSAPDEESSPDEGTQADADYAQEGMEAQAQGSPDDMHAAIAAQGGPTPQDMAKAQQIIASKGGGGGMPAGVGRGGGMDAMISASMGGDVPGGPRLRAPNIGGPNMKGPGAPSALPPPTKGTNQDMIRQMYREAAAKDRGVAQTGVKRGPRTGGSR